MAKIKYKLSFENYLEMTSSRREKKDFKIAAVSTVVGFFCITAGYLFLKLRESFFPGGWLLASGLLLAFAGMILAFFAKPRSVRPDTKTLRREYELGFADNRSIEFDENGWRLCWYEGEDVRPWSCLRQIYDLETLFVLATNTTYYWLPKDALERERQLEPLRALAEFSLINSQVLFQIALRPPALVYVAARIFHGWRRHLKPRVVCFLVLALSGYWLFTGTDDSLAGSPWPFAVVFFVLFLGEALYYLACYYTEDWSKTSTNAEILDDRTAYRTKAIHWVVEHRQLLELRETWGAFLLYFEPNRFYTFPKRSFSEKQMTQFRELLQKHLF